MNKIILASIILLGIFVLSILIIPNNNQVSAEINQLTPTQLFFEKAERISTGQPEPTPLEVFAKEVKKAEEREQLEKLIAQTIIDLRKMGEVVEDGNVYNLSTAREIKDSPYSIEAKVNGEWEKITEYKWVYN